MALTKTTNWQRTDEHRNSQFSADELINAYLKGVQEGTNQTSKAIKKQLENNLQKAGEHTSKIISELKGKKYNIKTAFLKIHSWDEIEVIILLPQEQFLNPDFHEVYNLIAEYEEKFKEDLYSITFSFTDYDDSLDKEQMESDGFILEYKMTK
jgi:hypothetical protein